MMKTWTIISFTLVALLIALHIEAFASRDPNGYGVMVLFFYGVPLAIVASVVSAKALVRTGKKLFWVPLTIGLLPILGWPTVFVLEFLRIIP